MTSAQRKANAAQERAGEMELVSFARNSTKLEEGEYPFEGCVIDEWKFKDDAGNDVVLPYLAIDTESDGRQALLSGILFNTYLADEDNIVGKVIKGNKVNPIVDLTGVLIVTKNGNTTNLELQGVSASQLAA